MLDLARHKANFPQLRTPQLRTDADLRALGYAPNPVHLAGRQLEVARMVALGLADKEIAHCLSVSQGTVKGHVSTILRLLGLYRRTQICRFVYEAGLILQDWPGADVRPAPMPQDSPAEFVRHPR